MREVNTNSGICRADVVKLLLDREWHSMTEVVQALAPKISPEEASRIYITAVGGRNGTVDKRQEYMQRRASEPEDVRVALGKKKIVERIVYSDRRIETKSVGDPVTYERQAMIRLSYWHCWSCGAEQNGNGCEAKRLCKTCAEVME